MDIERNKLHSCDLLEKSYFCSIANNCAVFRWAAKTVVICLKNRTFAVSQTTRFTIWKSGEELWFAWKIVLLQYRKQQAFLPINAPIVVICLKNRTFAVSQTTRRCTSSPPCCCDLLEKSYFCSIANNLLALITSRMLLWFAWKIVLLQYRKQHRFRLNCGHYGCDLLEKSYFCSIANNIVSTAKPLMSVVICLKNRTFAVSQTTFKGALLIMTSCDLLEKSYFCSIANNTSYTSTLRYALWFAWKIVLLQYRKQLLFNRI